MHQLKANLDQSKRVIEILKSKIQQLQEEHGVNIDKPLETDLEKTIEESTSKVHELHPPGSFLCLFWDHQLQANRIKDVVSSGGIQ